MHTFDEAFAKQDLTGRRVAYMLNQADVDEVESRRQMIRKRILGKAPEPYLDVNGMERLNTQEYEDATLANAIRSGNALREGDVYPGVIVSPWHGPHCNIQVFLDGTDSYWATSRSEFHEDGPADPNTPYGQGRWHFHAGSGEEVEMAKVNVLLIEYQDEHGRESKLTDALEAADITWSWEPDARGTWIFADSPA